MGTIHAHIYYNMQIILWIGFHGEKKHLIKQKNLKYPNNRLMSNIIYLLFLIIFLNNCSFDNKTGIWTGSDQVVKKNKEDINQNIEFIFKKQSNIIKKKELSVDEPLEIDEPTSYYEWSQSYQKPKYTI